MKGFCFHGNRYMVTQIPFSPMNWAVTPHLLRVFKSEEISTSNSGNALGDLETCEIIINLPVNYRNLIHFKLWITVQEKGHVIFCIIFEKINKIRFCSCRSS